MDECCKYGNKAEFIVENKISRQFYHINFLGLQSEREKKELILTRNCYCFEHFRENHKDDIYIATKMIDNQKGLFLWKRENKQ